MLTTPAVLEAVSMTPRSQYGSVEMVFVRRKVWSWKYDGAPVMMLEALPTRTKSPATMDAPENVGLLATLLRAMAPMLAAPGLAVPASVYVMSKDEPPMAPTEVRVLAPEGKSMWVELR